MVTSNRMTRVWSHTAESKMLSLRASPRKKSNPDVYSNQITNPNELEGVSLEIPTKMVPNDGKVGYLFIGRQSVKCPIDCIWR